MPEGDTIHRAAHTLRLAIGGHRVTGWRSALPSLRAVDDLVGRTVASVQARAKYLLVCFDDGRTLLTHMKMDGSWHVYRAGEAWRLGEHRAFAVIETETWVAVCFDAPICELLPPGGAERALAELGPDLLDPTADLLEAARRLRAHGDLPIGEALLRQSLVGGIGNVYKSEVLFVRRVSPFAKVRDTSDEELAGLLGEARRLMRQNLGGGPRTTRRRFGSSRLWVYGRSGRPCYQCGSAVRMRRQGDAGRSTYYCPRCQAGPVP